MSESHLKIRRKPERNTYELGDYERMLEEALVIVTKDKPCPRCENTTYYFLGPVMDPWLDICCQKCGFRLQYLIDVLVESYVAEENNED